MGAGGGSEKIAEEIAGAEAQSYEEPLRYEYPKLDDAALHGLPGEFVKLVGPVSESDAAALLIQFLVAAGCAIGRTAYHEIEATEHYTNLFALAVGPTASSRKGTSWGHARKVALEAGVLTPANIKAGLSSGEGVIHAVRDPVTKSRSAKDGGVQPVVVDAGVEDKRLLLYAPEFSQALKVASRETNILSEVLRHSWETGDLRILNKNSPEEATGAHIAIVGHITQFELCELVRETDVANGTLNRFLIYSVRRARELPFGGHVDPEAWAFFVQRFGEAVAKAKTLGRLDWASRSRPLWAQAYSLLSAGKPGLLGAVVSRAEAQTLRIASLYAALRGSRLKDIEDLEAALAVWTYCEDSARFIFGDRLGNPVADRILDALRQNPDGLTRTQVSELFARNVDSERLDKALESLRAQFLAESREVPTQGRPIQRWRAVKVGFQNDELNEERGQ